MPGLLGPWRALIDHGDFARLLRDFTFNFLLITQLETDSALQLVKFSYKQHLPYSKLLLTERVGSSRLNSPSTRRPLAGRAHTTSGLRRPRTWS